MLISEYSGHHGRVGRLSSLLSQSICMLKFLETGSLEPIEPVQFPAVAIQFLPGMTALGLLLLPDLRQTAFELSQRQHIAGLRVPCAEDQRPRAAGVNQGPVIGDQYYAY